VKKSLNLMQAELGEQAFSAIKSVNINQQLIVLNYQIPQNFNLLNSQGKGRLFVLRDQLALFGDIDKIRFYFQRLLRFTNQDKAPTTLIDYLSTMLSLAAQQTIINKGALAKDENQAALLALAIYFGDEKFELLVGEISQLSSKEQQHREYLITHVKLSKRNDLQQHYIYSLAIQIFSNMGVSNTIGELKELLDSNLGGSGFSFADLMADRAGTKLAMIATHSNESALYVQHFFTPLKKNKQLIILPCFGDLEEGLSQVNFEHNYRNVNSEAYQTMIAIIDQRISQLDLYRSSVN